MTRRGNWAAGIACCFLLVLAAVTLGGQIRFATGQDVAPVFEGWEQNPDGTYSMVFGYLNRNYEEEVDIPIGPNNTIEPSGDRGQPTHFYPRRQRFVFKVVVPKDWDKQQRLVWTLTSRGKTNQAKAWLQPEWELNDEVIAENNGGGVIAAGNEAPSIRGSSAQTVTLPNAVTLTVTATDDGLPKRTLRPGASTSVSDPNLLSNQDAARRESGVQIKWIVYRGPGKVQFSPATSGAAVYGQPVTLTSKASFSAPGTYVLRAVANDGQLSSTYDVTVTVK
ncbi:MAG TPA: hypothetical protein VE422_35300 [Terriglobia bacterium]|nr:hypothetical protein [Terriglobia bacterium]